MTTMRLGPYELRRRLGTGGMAEVWEGWDGRLQRQVAVKLVDRTSARSEHEARHRLLREARAVAALDHPAIVRIHDVIEGEERDAIVMELVVGETLRQRIDRLGVLEESDALVFALQVAEALAAAHSRGVIHRDLKTENVMVDENDRIKILDFGLAKRLHSSDSGSFTYSGRILGTVRSMSPEQVTGEPVDERSDLYSLGILIYESLTGISPFVGKDLLDTIRRISDTHQAPIRTINSDASVDASDLVEALLEKKPEDRPQSIDEVVSALRDLIGSTELRMLSAEDDVVDPATAEPATGGLSSAALAGLAVAALTVLVLAAYFLL